MIIQRFSPVLEANSVDIDKARDEFPEMKSIQKV